VTNNHGDWNLVNSNNVTNTSNVLRHVLKLVEILITRAYWIISMVHLEILVMAMSGMANSSIK
jgi:hypothetical protein